MNPSWPSESYRMLVELEDRSKIWFIIPSCTYFILMSSRSKFSFRSVHTCMMKIVSEQLNENWLYRFASHYILPVCNNILLFIERLDFVEILLSTIYYLLWVARMHHTGWIWIRCSRSFNNYLRCTSWNIFSTITKLYLNQVS